MFKVQIRGLILLKPFANMTFVADAIHAYRSDVIFNIETSQYVNDLGSSDVLKNYSIFLNTILIFNEIVNVANEYKCLYFVKGVYVHKIRNHYKTLLSSFSRTFNKCIL